MLDRHHLAIIREIDRQGSMTAAADKLFVTQSALSHTIKKLEQQLGTPLWMREGRSLHFTQAGYYLLSVANRLLPQLEHAEAVIGQMADGQRGTLRIGMECHPCYQWLLKVVAPYLERWRQVDVDVKQKFQFGGLGALLGYDIDMLVTPDPLHRTGLVFTPVYDYEQVLVVSREHPLAGREWVEPEDLADEILITYPVETERLDIFNLFLLPARILPRKHKTIETTDILLQMVAATRGVAALPRWLVEEYAHRMPLLPVRLGQTGLPKQIFLGVRQADEDVDYLTDFLAMARSIDW
ncbi:LysR family transcriptional regulator [Marinobacter sp. R17]|uniref:LysR family transcriptional regulator n=1 Tax=Marinobacter sp. R17 TaxID=2484250 RepID=UPI000F4C6E9A|nr:LysR family transcriptional regulator [Marinobacter sp. R17]ROU01687.1 LysR family transcriptional regulator [Marinobacter sp. R17]